jgi:hypothetical protein
MKNAHERFGVLEYTKRTKDTTTRVRLRMDHFIGEIERQGNGRAHLLSVLGSDSDVGAVWAGVNEHGLFTVEGTWSDSITVTLGEDAQCFRGTIAITGRKPIRHLVAVSADVAKPRAGADPEGKRTVLCDDDPTFIFYRIAQRFGLPVVPEWAGWFKEELRRHEALQPLVGLGCSPVLVTGTKKLFLKWIGRALRQNRIRFPESNGAVRWSVAHEFFGSGPTATEQRSGADGLRTVPLTHGEKQS